MPEYVTVGINYEPHGPFKVWVESRTTFSVASLAKVSDPSSLRQAQFESELLRLRDHLGCNHIPVFVSWLNAGKKRMDKGCIGHAVASGFLQASQNTDGYVDYVNIQEQEND